MSLNKTRTCCLHYCLLRLNLIETFFLTGTRASHTAQVPDAV